MRIRELDQRAFGHFSGHRLAFMLDEREGGAPGFHVAYGPNEAGKTTTLFAIRYGLYGIPDLRADPRTYDFLHHKPELRIAMVLEADSGETLEFTRRKKTGTTCFDFADTTGAPETQHKLDLLLHGVDRDLFARKYGIDYEALREGGKGLADANRTVGESLFAAETGIVGIHTTLKTLATEVEALLKSTGRRGTIADAIKRFSNAQTAAGKARRAARSWHPKQEEIVQAKAGLRTARAKLGAVAGELEQATSIRSALPAVIERQAILADIAALGSVLEAWSPEREEHRSELQSVLASAENDLRDTDVQLEEQRSDEKRLAAIADGSVLAVSERIRQMSERIGEYVSARSASGELTAAYRAAAEDVASACCAIGVGAGTANARELIPPLPVRAQARALLGEHDNLRRDVSAAHTAMRDAADELAAFDLESPPPPVPIGLEFLRATVKGAESVDTGRLAELDQNIAGKARQLAASVMALGRCLHDVDALRSLHVPLNATVEDCDSRLRATQNNVAAARHAVQQSQARLKELNEDITELSQLQDVPTTDELAEHRQTRDMYWRRIRAAWLDGETAGSALRQISPGTEAGTADIFETALRDADMSADRRLLAAETLGRLAALEADGNRLAAETIDQERLVDELLTEQNVVQNEWDGLWTEIGVESGTVAEMREWMTSLAHIRSVADSLDDMRADARSLRDRVERVRRDLSNALAKADNPPPSDDLSVEALGERAQAVLDEADRAKEAGIARDTKRKSLKANLDRTEKQIEQQDGKLAAWTEDWHATATAIGLAGDASADAGKAMLEAIDSLESAVHSAESATRASEQNQRVVTAFECDARQLLETIGGETAESLREKPADQAIREVAGVAENARDASVSLVELKAAIRHNEERKSQNEREMVRANAGLQQLLAEVGLSDVDELNEAASRWNQRREYRAQLRDTEHRITELTKMKASDVDAFLGQTPSDQLPAHIAKLQGAIAEIEGDIEERQQKLEGLQRELGGLETEARVEASLADMADARARIESLAVQYTRLKLQHDILANYLQERTTAHIGPALTRAGELFRELTCGNYTGITQDVGDDDVPVLKVISSTGSALDRVGLSTATADQLYLALRLASIYQQLDQPEQEAIPFIVDDILTTFDDDRSAATMRVLADLATRTQVIFFTHHQHLVELAQREVPSDLLSVQGIEPTHDAGASTSALISQLAASAS